MSVRNGLPRLAALGLLLAGISGSHAFGQQLDWAVGAGGTLLDAGHGIAVDGSGNSYVTGYFSDLATFGADEPNETVLQSAGGQDIFVAKYAANGALLWVTAAGGGNHDQGLGIAVDSAGNSYVTGFFRNLATFGAGEVNETWLQSAGSANLGDIFVAKYDANGALLWATRAGGPAALGDRGNSIAVDVAGNSYVTGWFRGLATFGFGDNQAALFSQGSSDIFVAKYDAGGALLWVRGGASSSASEGLGVAVDLDGHSYVTGRFFGLATFGAGEVNQTTLEAAGVHDIFVAKYHANGALLWARRAGGTYLDQGFGIAVDGAGQSFVTGFFGLSATFGAGEANETTLEGVGTLDIFVAKYRTDGTLLWARRAGGLGVDSGFGIAVDPDGHGYVTGRIGDFQTTFGAGEANETVLQSAGLDDIFVAKYDANGTLQWARRAGWTMQDHGYGIAVDHSGHSYVTGSFYRFATFGEGEANETLLHNGAETSSIFVARFLGDVTLVNTPPVAVAGPDLEVLAASRAGTMVTLDASGSFDAEDAPGDLTYAWTGPFGTVAGQVVEVLVPPGAHGITLTVTDTGGLHDSDTLNVSVFYGFTLGGGFQPPVAGAPVVNVGQSGRSYPVRWQLPDGSGGFVRDLGVVQFLGARQVNCDTTAPEGNMEEADATGMTGLRYDTDHEQYVFNWSTSRSWGGTCQTLILQFDDGNTYHSHFAFR